MDWAASILGIIGCIILGGSYQYKRIGWLFYAGASAINVYLGYHAGLIGLSAGAGCYMILEIKGFITHHRGLKK